MESMFQNCVTEFDLNFLGERTDVNQATPLTQCQASRKYSIARVKERVKGVSQVVQKAIKTNNVLIDVQKELSDTKQELDGARNLIFEKNEEYKVICDERNAYFKQAEEYSKEIQNLKEQLKNFSEIDFNTKLKDKIIKGYSEQIKGLQVEMEKLTDNKKDSEKSSSFAVKQARASKNIVEKRLARVLKEYVLPTIKKRDRWLAHTIKRYLPEAVPEEDGEVEEEFKEIKKVTETGENQEYANLNKDSSAVNPIINRNTSFDFDNVGSIDTGRGSSLALSDGEKSFHSPDYYMHNSPPCIVRSIGKSDVSTSPIIFEKSDIDHNEATITCKTCAQLSKKDTCTSPIPLLNLEKRVPTTDSFNSEECNSITDHSLKNSEISHKKEMISSCIDNSMKDSRNTIQEPNIKTTPMTLQDFTFDSDDDDDDNGVVTNDSDCSSPVEELKALSPVHCPEAVTKSQTIKTNESGKTATKKYISNRQYADNSKDTLACESLATSPCNMQTPSMGSVIQTTIVTESEEEVRSNVLKTFRKSHLFSPTDFVKSLPKSVDIEIQRSPAVSLKPSDTPRNPENNNNRKIHQEQECLELNNSNNFHDDTATNIEISEILNKMRLHHRLLTPIPTTPPRRKNLSPILSLVNLNAQAEAIVSEAMNEQLDLLKTTIQQAMTPIMNTMLQRLREIPQIFSCGNLNEERLHNLHPNPNKGYENDTLNENLPTRQLDNHPSCNVNAELHNKLQPDVVDLNTGTMLCIEECNNEDYTGSDFVDMEEDTDTEFATIQNINDGSSNGIEGHSKNHSELEKSNMPNSSVNIEVATGNAMLPKTDESVILEAIPSAGLGITHKREQDLFCKANGNDNNSQNIVVQLKDRSSSAMDSRCSIVYESIGISDEDGEAEIPVEDLPTERKRKGKRLSKLQTLRMRMKPKPKIKNDVTTSVKKLSAKPVPTNTPTSKKKVTEFDNAASLNEKSVYENAVKVVASFRLTKQPRLILSDCVKSKYETKAIEKNNEDKKSLPTINTKNNEVKISDNLSKVPVTNTFDVIGTNTSKENNTLLDDPITTNHSNDITPQKSSGIERNNTKQSYNLRNSVDTRDINETIRKRISFSESDTRNDNASTSNKESRNSIDTRKIKETKRKRICFSECDTRNDNSSTSNKESRKSIDTREIKETKRKRISFSECDTRNDIASTSNKESRKSIDTREINETKRKTISVSEYDTRNDNASKKETVSPKILRSSPRSKSKKESEPSHIISPTRAGLRSRIGQNITVIDDIYSGISMGRKCRIAQQNSRKSSEKINNKTVQAVDDTDSEKGNDVSVASLGKKSKAGEKNTIRNSGSADSTADSLSSTLSNKLLGSDTSSNENNKAVSKTNCNLILNEYTTDKKLGENKLETEDTLTFSLGKKRRIAHQNIHNTPQCTNTEEQPSKVLNVSKGENSTEVTYADIDLFTITENTQDQINNHTKGVIDKNVSKTSRLTRNTTTLNSDNTVINDIYSGISMERKCRIGRQNSCKYSEKNNYETDQTVDKNDSEKDDNVCIASLLRKSRTCEKNTIGSTESAADSLCSTVSIKLHGSDTSKKYSNEAVAKSNCNLLSNENTSDKKMGGNKLETENTLTVSLGKKRRIAQQNTYNTVKCTNIEEQSSNLPNIFKKENSRGASYADINLFTTTENTQGHIENHAKSVTDEATNMSKTTRLTRSTTTRNSVGTQHNVSREKVSAVCYDDLNMFSNEDTQEDVKPLNRYTKDSLLCRMIEKYGVQKHKFVAKKTSESKVNEIAQRLETRLSEIIEGPHEEYQKSMKRLVAEIRDWNIKDFILGFIKFLKNPERKLELFNKSTYPPCPPMTKKEQVLLYVLDELQKSFDYRNIVNKILMNIEYTLFAINKAGESYDVIEAISHFYALLCRNYQKLSKLRLFIIDAMYCLQLKSVIVVQQCLEVWMSVLPLGHMGIAKTPLVTCLVYLLHFYKCDDKFNRVQNIRNTLRWKYNYDLNDWNEKKILDMFRTAILEIQDSQSERKTLRLSLLILAKRHGAKWCHTNIVKNMLQPLINDSATSDGAKRFCVSLLGPLLKPYPAHMKVHYEMVIDYLMDMLHRKNSLKMQEAIISSLIYIDKNNNRFHQFLAKWTPEQVSPEFHLVFRDYIRSKTVQNWKQILTWKIK